METHHLQQLVAESTHRFTTEFRAGSTDFSSMHSIFSRLLLHHRGPPPLELLWLHAALSFHSTKRAHRPPKPALLLTKDLFHLLVSGSPRIAALAPVVSQLYHTCVLSAEVRADAESFLEGVIGYISVSFCEGDAEAELGFSFSGLGFVDLARVWEVERFEEDGGVEAVLEAFLPAVSECVRERVVYEECPVGYLAGVVMCEAFLLCLSLKVAGGGCGSSRAEELRGWAVSTVAAFRSYCFIDILLGLLLEPFLPVETLLNSEDRSLLRNVLHDALILVACPLLDPARGIQLPDACWRNLFVRWLFVVDNAVLFARGSGDNTKANSYLQAFTESYATSRLINLVLNQSSMLRQTCLPCVSTPRALIQWLVNVEDQGLAVFGNDISKTYARTVAHQPRRDLELLKCAGDNKLGQDFNIGNMGRWKDEPSGDLEMHTCSDSTSFRDSRLLKLAALDGTKKRKEGVSDDWNRQSKCVKYHLIEDCVRRYPLPSVEDGLVFGSEVDNRICNEEKMCMEV